MQPASVVGVEERAVARSHAETASAAVPARPHRAAPLPSIPGRASGRVSAAVLAMLVLLVSAWAGAEVQAGSPCQALLMGAYDHRTSSVEERAHDTTAAGQSRKWMGPFRKQRGRRGKKPLVAEVADDPAQGDSWGTHEPPTAELSAACILPQLKVLRANLLLW